MKKQENNVIYLLKRDTLIKVIDRMIKKDFKNIDRYDVKKIVDIINYYVDWKKHYQKRVNIVFEIKEVLRYFFYLECKYDDAFKNNPMFKEDDGKEKMLSKIYWDLSNILYILIRKCWPTAIPISDEDSPYSYLMCLRESNMDINLDIPKSRYILNDYLTYISKIWNIRYSDNFGLVQFLFFKFRDESEDFCRQMVAEIVSLLKSTGYKKDKQLLDRIKIFDSDEGISYPEYYKYYRYRTGVRYAIDSEILKAIDRIAEQQFVDSISYQEQEIDTINLLISETMH